MADRPSCWVVFDSDYQDPPGTVIATFRTEAEARAHCAGPGDGHGWTWFEVQMPADRTIHELIEASSLGTPEAKAARARVSDEEAAAVLERCRELARLRQAPAIHVRCVNPDCPDPADATFQLASPAPGIYERPVLHCTGCGHVVRDVTEDENHG